LQKRSGKGNSELVTPNNIIFDNVKELFKLVIALCTAFFFRAKINKKLWPPYFEWSGAGTVCSADMVYLKIIIFVR